MLHISRDGASTGQRADRHTVGDLPDLTLPWCALLLKLGDFIPSPHAPIWLGLRRVARAWRGVSRKAQVARGRVLLGMIRLPAFTWKLRLHRQKVAGGAGVIRMVASLDVVCKLTMSTSSRFVISLRKRRGTRCRGILLHCWHFTADFCPCSQVIIARWSDTRWPIRRSWLPGRRLFIKFRRSREESMMRGTLRHQRGPRAAAWLATTGSSRRMAYYAVAPLSAGALVAAVSATGTTRGASNPSGVAGAAAPLVYSLRHRL